MRSDVYIYILVMAVVTYLIRMLPLAIIRKEIKNVYLRSFFHYVPYVTLAVMAFPAIIHATSSIWSGIASFITAAVCAYFGGSLFRVAFVGCITVFLVELIV